MKTTREITKKYKAREKRIVVATDTMNNWKLKRQHGDIQRIVREKKLSVITVTNAFNGFATPRVIRMITNFLNKK